MKSIEFLDMPLTGDNNEIILNLYRKPTAGNMLLHADSSHPGHTINSIPVDLFLRLKRVCSRNSDFKREATLMSSRFEDRGYSKSVINRALKIANKVPQDNLSTDKPAKGIKSKHGKSEQFSNTPTFSTSYSTEFNKIQKIITKYLPVLSNDPIYSQILAKGIRTVSRRAPSLSKWLSPSLYTSKQNPTNWLSFKGIFKCGKRGCAYCPFFKGGDTVLLATTGKSHKISSFFNCNTRFVVYVITCTLCSIQYVGRTTLKDSLYDHFYDIEKDHSTNVARHCNELHCKDTSSLVIQGV